MANHFFDTSALVKRYHVENGTTRVNDLLQQPGTTCYVSRLGVVEMRSAFARSMRTGRTTLADLQQLQLAFANDLKRGTFRVLRLLGRHFEEAERLVIQHGIAQGMRTLDALQLAVALELHQQNLIDDLVCADQNLCAVATLEGLSVIEPTVP